MPVSIAFRFPAKRYHATPHGHHVNEGLIEWPPSPWRLLRALLSVGYTSGAWNGDGPRAEARNLLAKLSKKLPRYHLPPVLGTHSRHYMPIGGLDSQKLEKKNLVFDTWARIDSGELVVTWHDIDLDEAEFSTLETLVESLNYLGRSESWVEGRLMCASEPTEINCFPEQKGEKPGIDWEQVVLPAPIDAARFEAWRADNTKKILAEPHLQPPAGRKPSEALLRKRAKAVEPYPTDLLDCLHKDTNWLRKHGWSQPPGSQRVFYWRKSDAITVGSPRAKRANPPIPQVKAMLLSLTNASRNDHALPPLTRTLPQAELLHRALVGIAAKRGPPPSELTGRDENRRPLRGAHGHAHINPLDLDQDGHLDHVLIWAPQGLGAEAQAAVRATRKTFTKGGIEPLRLALAATGDPSDLARLPGGLGQRVALVVGQASAWRSVTPFVPPRYIKARGKHTLEQQIRAELNSRGFPEPKAVHPLAPKPDGGATTTATSSPLEGSGMRWLRFRHFVLSRQRGPQPPVTRGFAIRLEFESPVPGPIALGYGSHFGLGLFERS